MILSAIPVGTSIPLLLGQASAQKQDVPTEPQDATAVVRIPNGAANPTVDLTLQNVGNWYDPKRIIIQQGDAVTWKNEDIYPHTVTSGSGAGIQSLQTNEKGKYDGIFDSGIFEAGESWSYKFDRSGTYTYFCTIHPWMEGVVAVNPIQVADLPQHPVDASGNKQEEWPVHTISRDGNYDIDLKWDPVPILTGKTVTFIADFFDARTNKHLQLVPHEFVLLQNGSEFERIYGLTDVGVAIYKFEFSEPGPIIIRLEKVGDKTEAVTEFSTIVYSDPERAATISDGESEVTRVSGGTPPVSRILNPLTLVWVAYGVIFGIPAAVGLVIFLFKKGII